MYENSFPSKGSPHFSILTEGEYTKMFLFSCKVWWYPQHDNKEDFMLI